MFRLRRSLPQPAPAPASAIPIPPAEMRALVGPTEIAAFDNPSASIVFPNLPAEAYDCVFDFGCGCGRIARQLIQQEPRPSRYVGVDLHRGMIEWCRTNLVPFAPEFEFRHHDVFNASFNPGREKPDVLPLPAADGCATLVIAFSVFTHLTEAQAVHYLRECARILAPDGVLHSTWFMLDKREFPMLQPATNALYASYSDPSAAVIFDRAWIRATARAAGLKISGAVAPRIRGYQWVILLRSESAGVEEIELPPDEAPLGTVELAPMPPNADEIGTS